MNNEKLISLLLSPHLIDKTIRLEEQYIKEALKKLLDEEPKPYHVMCVERVYGASRYVFYIKYKSVDMGIVYTYITEPGELKGGYVECTREEFDKMKFGL